MRRMGSISMANSRFSFRKGTLSFDLKISFAACWLYWCWIQGETAGSFVFKYHQKAIWCFLLKLNPRTAFCKAKNALLLSRDYWKFCQHNFRDSCIVGNIRAWPHSTGHPSDLYPFVPWVNIIAQTLNLLYSLVRNFLACGKPKQTVH